MEPPSHGQGCVKRVGDVLHQNICGVGHEVQGFELYGPLLMKSLQQPFKINRDDWVTPWFPVQHRTIVSTSEQIQSEQEWRDGELAFKLQGISTACGVDSAELEHPAESMIPSLEIRKRTEAEEEARRVRISLESIETEKLTAAAVPKKKKKHRKFRFTPAGRMCMHEKKKVKTQEYHGKRAEVAIASNVEVVFTKADKKRQKFNKWKKLRKRGRLCHAYTPE